MKDQVKHCDTCAHSYHQNKKNIDGGDDAALMQHCSHPVYNSPIYTKQMLLEDWSLGYCRFWAPQIQGGPS